MEGMPSRATIGVVAVTVAAGLWGMDALIRRPLAHSTEPATIVLGEHVVLVLVLLPVVVAALPAVWRAGPRFVAAAIVVGAGSSAQAGDTSPRESPWAPGPRPSRRSSSRRRSWTATR